MVRGSNEEAGADLREGRRVWVQRPAVSTEQSSEARTGGKGVRSGQVRRGERRRKTNRAPMRLMQRAMEERRQRESVRTQQEWSRLRRIDLFS